MSDRDLLALAEAAGLTPHWRDAFGQEHDVPPDTLRRVLGALGLPAGSDVQVAESRRHLDAQAAESPPLVTADAGRQVHLRLPPGRFRIRLEDGGTLEGEAAPAEAGAVLTAPDRPGYHLLELGGHETTLAVAPPRCLDIEEVTPGRKLWGLALQLYSLRRQGDGGIGDFAALPALFAAAARHGASAVAISPVHAQFSADTDRFSPYAPSSRVLLNVLHADADFILDEPPTEEERRLEALDLIDWPAAGRARLARLRRAYDRLRQDRDLSAALDRYRAEAGDVLESHARFEALHAHFYGADPGRWHWRSWPEEYRAPTRPEVAAFARDHAAEVGFHAFLQFLADRGLAAAQRAARTAGMKVGLIADLAVGTDSGGSQGWSRPEEMLIGLSIGAPPDLLGPGGQDWGLSAFSPRGLRSHGYGAFLEMLRASLRHAGGVRIDHVMGLSRLWVMPEGAGAQNGVYLRFPEADLLRLLKLESTRHRAVILGEDLGTLPSGYQERLQAAGVLGMRVLWFERDEDRFRPPQEWSREAAAMTSTHDLATVAGWWRGHDLDWRARLGLLADEAGQRAQRARDRSLLWDAFRRSGAAQDAPPPPAQGEHAAGSACVHVGRAACLMALLPIEDALALPEQPNLPGTLHEHPNWRRRLPAPAERLLEEPVVAGRLGALDRARRGE